MIYFFADNHYQACTGENIYKSLEPMIKSRISFCADQKALDVLESGKWLQDCELLILHLIGETCGLSHAGPGSEKAVREWYDRGGNILLLHGSSAAFWHWDWYRKIAGMRWVRPGDPDGVTPSTHPVHPYTVSVCKTRHELTTVLQPMDLPSDEIYINLEQTAPLTALMATQIEEGYHLQCFESYSPAGGKILSFLPGHGLESVRSAGFMHNIHIMIDYLLRHNKITVR